MDQYQNQCAEPRKEPYYTKLDRRIKELDTDIDYLTKQLESTKNRQRGLKELRKTITKADEAKIQALIDAGLV